MHDLITLGEVLLRLAIPSPARFETARALDVQIGGAEANVAAACARLGLRTAWISALPDNPWGERVRRELVGHGIDCAYVRMLPGTRLGLYFLEYSLAARRRRLSSDWTAVRRTFWTRLRDAHPRRLSPYCKAGTALRCSMEAGCGVRPSVTPFKWWIRSGQATPMSPATSGQRLVDG